MPEIPDHKAHLKKLIGLGDIGRAIEELCNATGQNGQSSLHNNLLSLSGRYHRNLASRQQGVITVDFFNTQLSILSESLNYYIEEYQPSGSFDFEPIDSTKQASEGSDESAKPVAVKKKVFISYSTADRETADKIKVRLEAAGIDVSIDYQDFLIGEDLLKSINQHLKANGIVLSLISENSLKSKWVAEESMIVFYTEQLTDKLFIPAFLDDFMFQRSFVRTALSEIHQEIVEIRLEIDERNKNKWPIEDLAPDLDYYEKLASNLPGIVKRFRSRLAVDLRPDKFDEGVDKIIKHIQKAS